MFMKKAMLLTSQSVYDAMEELKGNFMDSAQYVIEHYSDETELERKIHGLKESFKKDVNDRAYEKVSKQYPAIKNKYQEAYDWVHENFHPEDDEELTAGEMYFAMFIAIKQTNAPSTRAGLLDGIQNRIFEEAFDESDKIETE